MFLVLQVSRAVALQGIVAAPGVVRGAHERCWWAYHPDAVRSAIVVVGKEGSEEEEEEEEAQVDEIRGFFTRYQTLDSKCCSSFRTHVINTVHIVRNGGGGGFVCAGFWCNSCCYL